MPDSQIEFLLVGELAEITFNPGRPEGIDFGPTEESVSISLRPLIEERSGLGPVEYRATISKAVGADEFAFIASFVGGHYLEIADAPLALPFAVRGDIRIDGAGNIREGAGLRFEHLPPAVQRLCKDADALLKVTLDRFLKLLRWHQEIDAPPSMMPSPALYWRTAPGSYSHVPFPKQESEGRSPAGLQWAASDQQELDELWRSKAEEPLGHELLREATSLIQSAPRAALLGLSSALEAGVKWHIAQVLPEAVGLIAELPSPPINKLLRYVRGLHEQRSTVALDWEALRPLFKACHELAEDRNIVTHRGQMPARANLSRYCSAVGDVLYILDYARGCTWATQNVSRETSAALKWPRSTRGRMYVRVRVE